MKLTELKDWINSLPQELQENLDVVVAREGKIDEEYSYRLDAPIIELSVDESSKEALIYIKNDRDEVSEDAAPAGMATLGAGTGMGTPQYANRGVEGSGDIPVGRKKKKKRKKKEGEKSRRREEGLGEDKRLEGGRVGKEWRTRWSTTPRKKKNNN